MIAWVEHNVSARRWSRAASIRMEVKAAIDVLDYPVALVVFERNVLPPGP